MKLHLTNPKQTHMFTGYDESTVQVNQQDYQTSLVVTTEQIHQDWLSDDIDQLQPEHFEQLSTLEPEVVLVGTGKQQHFLHPKLFKSLTSRHIAVEFMDSAAACRTYNILVAEDRKVAALIFL